MSIFDIASCEEKIGYVFKDKMLLRKCFTHASYANEHRQEDNELLEFYGDAIMEFVVTEYLFNNAKGDEGKLTKKRADIVSKDPLIEVVKKLDIDEFVLLGRGQGQSKNQDEKLYSSVYEALVAGIYIDGGMTAVKKFIYATLIKDYEEKYKNTEVKTSATAKSDFQEYVQKHKLGSVTYEMLSKSGPDHMPLFRVALLLNGKVIAEGKGGSKKEAEAESAKRALNSLKKQKQDGSRR